jgi:type IX secretion system PorP/SprF family membrane protein
MKYFLEISFFLLLSTLLKAQQLPFFTQYKEYHVLINPADISLDYLTKGGNMSFGGSIRRQFTSLSNNPQTQLLRGGCVFEGDDVSLNTGLNIIKDQTGPTGFTGAYLRLAGIVHQGKKGGFSAGFNAGLVQFRLNGSQIEFADPTDALANRDFKTVYPDIGLGIFAYHRLQNNGFLDGDLVSAGFSIPQVFGLDLRFSTQNKNFTIKRVPHYAASFGYYKKLYDASSIETSIWLRYVKNVPIEADFICRYQMNGAFSLGAGYSTNQTVHAELGLRLSELMGWDGIRIGYGFDMPFGSIAPYFGTAHEINLSFLLAN